MKKIILVLVSIIAISSTTACIQAGTTAQPSLTTSTQAAPTITVTSAPTSASTVTVTSTVTAAPPQSSPSSSGTPTVSPTKTSGPDFSSYNNSSFFISSYISATATTVTKNGTLTSAPVYNDIFVDLDLGGFFTHKDALLLARIPNITTRDDWIYMFNFPAFNLPFILNMGYQLSNPDAKLEFFLLNKSYFTDNYEKNPFGIYAGNLAKNPVVSTQGINSYKINDTGSLVAVFRTTNASDIAGWWVKYGGKHY
jgi:hypothetical protein